LKGRSASFSQSAGDILRLELGVDPIPMLFMHGNVGPAEEGYDLLTDEGSGRAAERISELASLAGIVITLPQDGAGRLRSMADVSRLLRGLFLLLKAFLQSPAKKFVVLMHSREDTETPVRLLAEGMLGLFLSVAQEHPSVQFRTLEIDRDTDLRVALRGALDRGCTLVEMIHRDGKVFTSEGHLAPSVFGDSSGLNLSPGDVVVMSGGATGITAHLARCLVPFTPAWSFGEDPLDPGIHRKAAPRTVRSGGVSSTTGPLRWPRPWRICTPQGSRQRTIPAM
jgi:hypothetical protein